MLIDCCRKLFMSARFRWLLHSRRVVADRAVAEYVTVAQNVTVAEYVAIAKHVTVAQQQDVREDKRSAKHRRTVTLHHVITKRHSLGPHVEVQTLNREPFVDAITQQEPQAIAGLVLVD